MVQAVIEFGEQEERIINIVKGNLGLKNKSEAVNFVIKKYEEEIMEPELRPEFITKMLNLEKKGKFTSYKSLSALRKEIENA